MPSRQPQPGTMHSEWLRLQTLVVLRWAAIAGQLGAILAAWRIYDIRIPFGPCLATIGAAVIANLVLQFVYPRSTRLGQRQAVAILLFDTAQLAALLALTGGLNNPFALLIVAPATIGATALQSGATAFLAASAIGMVTLFGWWNLPLRLAGGGEIRVPALFELGHWLAISVGVVFLSAYARRVAFEIHGMSEALLATQMALAREQKLTDLGGVVAAAAHELGTPLATITLVSAELAEELEDDPELRDDALLIRAQADRCRDILRDMGRAGKDDLQVHSAPLETLLREAAEPHAERGKDIIVTLPEGRQPLVLRRPEIIHGLRNLIQNAVDFARDTVWVDLGWSDNRITLRIADNGPGFPPHQIDRLGDPFIRRRAGPGSLPGAGAEAEARPGYEGMGLGLFIAKTLLERTGAEISFANGRDPFLSAAETPARSGAVVELVWPRARIEAPGGPLGPNRSFDGD
ncbi:ActS/PrrB/RegB family redox-sensitive histidine kinase [Frigidibacter sp. MR17.14]|uniref:sensor histidine kinase RegB n=1 Tax=Frigidibacter sp. MR17.14 TaxID=3126509 RepID=UPI003012CE1C